jgi:uncharacterized protein (DUF58 family)
MLWQRTLTAIRQQRFLQREKHYPQLVNESLQKELRQLASRATPVALDINLEVHQKLLGERLSPFAKSGFEFAETRLYQVGDNVRFINWRRYANTGELYINTFHEERRPQCWIIMDRRASMRFGTRVRLKVTQAAVYALFHMFKAQQHQLDIGAIVLDQNLHWYDARSSFAYLQPVVQHINAPCPPITVQDSNQLNQALRLLNVRLTPGCLVILISDFSDLDEGDVAFLNALANKHTLAAIRIIDPIESGLPAHGKYNIEQAENLPHLTLDCNDPEQLQAYNLLLEQRGQQIEMLFKQSGGHFKKVFSDNDYHKTDFMETT